MGETLDVTVTYKQTGAIISICKYTYKQTGAIISICKYKRFTEGVTIITL